MPTTTARQSAAITSDWTDLTTQIAASKGASGFIKHTGGMPVEIIMGGAAKPPETVAGVPLRQGQEEYCQADNIWVRCRSRDGATLMFVAVE